MEVETPLLEITKHLIDPHAPTVVLKGMVVSLSVRTNIPRFLFTAISGDGQVDGAIALISCEMNVLKIAPFPPLECPDPGAEPKCHPQDG